MAIRQQIRPVLTLALPLIAAELGWPEEAPTQRVESAQGQQAGKPRPNLEERNISGLGQGRDRKA